MKMTAGRYRVLRLLENPGAFALPDGTLIGATHDGRGCRLQDSWQKLLERHGYIEKTTPPPGCHFVFVWRRTDKPLPAIAPVPSGGKVLKNE